LILKQKKKIDISNSIKGTLFENNAGAIRLWDPIKDSVYLSLIIQR